jgi:hypothetical protein
MGCEFAATQTLGEVKKSGWLARAIRRFELFSRIE